MAPISRARGEVATMLRYTRSVFVCLAAFAFFGINALAQSDLGSIQGVVKDPPTASVTNATVTVKNETGLERQTKTNDAGFFAVTNLPPGIYNLAVEAAGFKK